jgi:FlaG/FlaF family flagellin (archaellin)
MTMSSPILATAFMVAATVILAMRATVVAASRKSMVKVPSRQASSRQRHPANTRLR